MKRWTLAAAAAAVLAAGLWHLPAIAQRPATPPPAAPAAAPATAPAAAAAAQPGKAPVAEASAPPELITFEEYRDFRLRYIDQSRDRLARELTASDLSATQKASLERRKAYYDRQATMPATERDALFRTRFDLIDTDHDGTLDSAERAAWRVKQRAHYRELATERAEPSAARH